MGKEAMTGDNNNSYTGDPNEEGRAWTNYYDWLLADERRSNDDDDDDDEFNEAFANGALWETVIKTLCHSRVRKRHSSMHSSMHSTDVII